MTELNPCPFCGGKAEEVEDALSARFDYPKAVRCRICHASHISPSTWNKRSTPEALNKWQEFAQLHNMTPEQFSKELLECAQAVLAIDLVSSEGDEVEIISGQNDGVYLLTFKRIAK